MSQLGGQEELLGTKQTLGWHQVWQTILVLGVKSLIEIATFSRYHQYDPLHVKSLTIIASFSWYHPTNAVACVGVETLEFPALLAWYSTQKCAGKNWLFGNYIFNMSILLHLSQIWSNISFIPSFTVFISDASLATMGWNPLLNVEVKATAEIVLECNFVLKYLQRE